VVEQVEIIGLSSGIAKIIYAQPLNEFIIQGYEIILLDNE